MSQVTTVTPAPETVTFDMFTMRSLHLAGLVSEVQAVVEECKALEEESRRLHSQLEEAQGECHELEEKTTELEHSEVEWQDLRAQLGCTGPLLERVARFFDRGMTKFERSLLEADVAEYVRGLDVPH